MCDYVAHTVPLCSALHLHPLVCVGSGIELGLFKWDVPPYIKFGNNCLYTSFSSAIISVKSKMALDCSPRQ